MPTRLASASAAAAASSAAPQGASDVAVHYEHSEGPSSFNVAAAANKSLLQAAGGGAPPSASSSPSIDPQSPSVVADVTGLPAASPTQQSHTPQQSQVEEERSSPQQEQRTQQKGQGEQQQCADGGQGPTQQHNHHGGGQEPQGERQQQHQQQCDGLMHEEDGQQQQHERQHGEGQLTQPLNERESLPSDMVVRGDNHTPHEEKQQAQPQRQQQQHLGGAGGPVGEERGRVREQLKNMKQAKAAAPAATESSKECAASAESPSKASPSRRKRLRRGSCSERSRSDEEGEEVQQQQQRGETDACPSSGAAASGGQAERGAVAGASGSEGNAAKAAAGGGEAATALKPEVSAGEAAKSAGSTSNPGAAAPAVAQVAAGGERAVKRKVRSHFAEETAGGAFPAASGAEGEHRRQQGKTARRRGGREEEEEEENTGETDNEAEENEEAAAAAARIAEEFSNWKVNCRVLYDLVMSHTLEWPSLTVQWLPGLLDGLTGDSSSTVRQRLLLGTHTSGAEENFLQVMEVTLPGSPIDNAAAQVYAERGADEYEGFAFGRSPCKFKIVKRFPHPGEVNCARHMPQQPSLVATTAVDGGVLIYDISLTSATATGPRIRCTGHSEECFGLAWNPQQQGLVASASNSGSVCLHQLQQQPAAATAAASAAVASAEEEKEQLLEPLQVFHLAAPAAAAAAVNDCCWLPGEPHLLLCCSDDSKLHLLDTRIGTNGYSPALTLDGRTPHEAGGEGDSLRFTCVSADSKQQHSFVCGDSEGNLRIFDRRRGTAPVHVIEKAHKEEITRVACCPNEEGLLLSASRDRFISIFDLKRTGQEQSEEDAEDGPPELVFTHGGHVAAVSDACWNGEDIASLDKAVASVGEDNKLQIWQLKRSVFLEDEEESEDDGEEVE